MTEALAPTPPAPKPPASVARFTVAALGALVGLGAALRLVALGDRALFGDEIHSLTLARGLGADWLGSGVLLASGGYGPFASWAEFWMAIGQLDEGLFRLPAAIAGVLLVAGVAIAAHRRLPAAEALLLTGLVACSPYLVFTSREARGYPIAVLAFCIALGLASRWLRGPSPDGWTLPGAVIAAAIATAFDVAVAPTLLLVALGLLAAVAKRGEFAARRRSLAAASLAAALCLLVLLPTIRGVVSEAGRASAESAPSWATLLGGAELAFGIPAFGVAAVLALGCWRLRVRAPRATAIGAALLVAQIALLAALRPRTVDVPWVAVRYAVHLLPLLLVAAAAALAPPRSWSERHPWFAALAAVLIVAAYAGLQHRLARYDAPREGCIVAHPLTWRAPGKAGREIDRALREAMPAFYRETLPTLPPGDVIEAPLLVSLPLYEWYRGQHRRGCTTAAAGDGLFQATVAPAEGLALRRTRNILDLQLRAPPGRFLIVHKRPWIEMARVSAALRRAGAAQHAVDPRAAAAIFAGTVALPADHPLTRGHLIHEDVEVAVYQLAGDTH